jgi:hypothetical protein
LCCTRWASTMVGYTTNKSAYHGLLQTELGHLRDLHLLEKTPGIFNHGWQPLRLYKPGFLLAFSLSLELSLLCILPPGALPPCFIPHNPPPGLSKSIALPFMSLDATGFPLLNHPQLAT